MPARWTKCSKTSWIQKCTGTHVKRTAHANSPGTDALHSGPHPMCHLIPRSPEPFTNLIALFRQLQEPLQPTPDLRRQLESTPPHDFVGNRKVVHVALSILILTVR